MSQMSSYKRYLGIGLLAILLLALGVLSTTAQDGVTGAMRFVHVVPGVDPIDIYTDGQLTISNLAYGQATGYVNLPSGDHAITVTQHEQTTTLWEQTVTLNAEIPEPITLVASSLETLQFNAYVDSFISLTSGNSRFMIVHAIEGGPNIDVTANGDVIITDLAYTQFLGTIDVPSNVYIIGAVAAGTEDVVLPETPIGLVSGTSEILILHGTPDEPQALVISAPTAPEADSGFVRLVHAAADAPDVDIYANEILIVPTLAYGNATEHIALPAGDYAVQIRAAGTTEALLDADLSVEAGAAQTVVALGSVEEISVGVFPDAIGGITPDKALINVINTLSGDSTVSVALDNGTTLTEELAAESASDVTTIDPVVAAPSVTFAIDGASPTVDLDEVTFYGGVYYNLIALGGSSPELLIAPTYLSFGLGSAPGAAPAVEVAVVSTPIAQETTPDPVVILATPAPTAAVQPVATAAPSLPTGRIVLDPGVNLQLRQYPDPNALSLGLAPSGSVLSIIGREGAPVDINGLELPSADGQPFVDLASLLPNEEADLDLQTTWLNVSFTTGDGGTITAWVIAQYLDVRAPDGSDQRLANLPTVPGNTPGQLVGVVVTPAPTPENRVTVVVIGLESGINLNIRRLPDSTGEVLARVQNDTVLDFIGLGTSGNWVFVRYITPENNIVTGWASTNFVEFRYRDQPVTTEELNSRGLLLTADEALERGEVSQGTPGVSQATRNPLQNTFVGDVNVNQDANLNLRRTPSDQAQVLVQIPAASRLVITGRTLDSLWLQTSFNNQIGWVATAFVNVSFNNQPADISAIPVVDTGVDTSIEVTPEATNAG